MASGELEEALCDEAFISYLYGLEMDHQAALLHEQHCRS